MLWTSLECARCVVLLRSAGDAGDCDGDGGRRRREESSRSVDRLPQLLAAGRRRSPGTLSGSVHDAADVGRGGRVVQARRMDRTRHRRQRPGRARNYTTWRRNAHPFNGPFSRPSRYRKGKTNLDFTEARDSEWQWHPLGHTQVCTSLQTDTTTAPHRSVFYRPDALNAAQPTASSTEGNNVRQKKEPNLFCVHLFSTWQKLTNFSHTLGPRKVDL